MEEDAMVSSPDPLNNSPTYYSPQKTRRSIRSRQSLPRTSSPTKQRFELDVGDLSPQKLIVTVEAESAGKLPGTTTLADRLSSPSRRPLKTRERTTTTTIPVKGLSDTEEEEETVGTPKRRGRPRKSAGTPVRGKNSRNGTPTRRSSSKRRSIGDLVDGDDENDVNFQLGKNVDIGRRRAKSRSRSAKGVSRRSSSVFSVPNDVQDDDLMEVVADKPLRISQTFDNDGVLVEDDPIAGNEQSRDIIEFGNARRSPRLPSSSSSKTRGISRPTPTPISRSPTRSVFSHQAEDSIALVPVLPSENGQGDFENLPSNDQDEVEMDEDDDVGEMREFDTILESEEFSMISVDSVPSLRQHFSSPVEREGDIAPRSISRSVESSNQVSVQTSDSTASGIDLGTTTPAQEKSAYNMLSVRNTVNNSFSSIPPQILEAATPGPKNHISKFQSAHSMVDDSFSSVAPEVLDAATPGRSLMRPELTFAGRSLPFSKPESLAAPEIASTAGRRSVSGTLSTTTRLPTPDETPSPGEDSSESLSVNKTKHNSTSSKGKSRTDHDVSFMRSSPPTKRGFLKAPEFEPVGPFRLGPAQTPSIVFSSPNLPPPMISQREPNMSKLMTTSVTRPPLSPVARAGQALQNILVPSSPQLRSQSLGSPFKSPSAERKSSTAILKAGLPSPALEREVSEEFPFDVSKNSHLSRSTRRSRQDDPFSMGGGPKRLSSSNEVAETYKLGMPGYSSKVSDPRLASIKSVDWPAMSEDEMSWQHEEEIFVSDHCSSSFQATAAPENAKQNCTGGRGVVTDQVESSAPKEVVVICSDAEDSGALSEDDLDELGLLIETINSSSPVESSHQRRNEVVDEPRRSKIPSPWRKNSKRLVCTDEISQSPIVSNDTGFSKTIRSLPTKRIESTHTTSDPVDEVEISSIQIPQKSNFQPRSRQAKENSNLDLSALLSPIKPLPVMPKEGSSQRTQDISAQENTTTPAAQEATKLIDYPSIAPFGAIPQKSAFKPSPQKRTTSLLATSHGLFSQAPKARISTPSAEDTSTPASQERSPLVTKKLQVINRNQTFPESEMSSPQTSDDSLVLSPISQNNKENTPVYQNTRTMKWAQSLHLATKITQTPIPDRNASPTKSCLRTPALNVNQSPSKNVVFASSSPMPSISDESILSPTQWSKAHWLLLELILANHHAEHERESSPSDAVSETKPKRRNSTRVISKLLGKKVTSQGEEMRFEQWHLEAVDEFRGRVPGWEEKVIAMRAFALIVGAERRAGGIIA